MKSLCIRLLVVFCFFSCPHFLFAQLPSYLPADGLVAWYPFNGNANDESGNGNDGVVNGATLAVDRFGLTHKAYQFDGIDDFIEVPVQQQNISSYAIMCWFQFPTSPISGDYKALVQASGGYPNSQYSLSLQISANPLFPNQADNKVSVSINGPGVFNGRISNSTYNDDIWHCLVGVWDAPDGAQTSSSFVKMYLDGALLNESATAVDYGSVLTPVSGYGNTLIGMMNHLIGGRYYHGGIDDIAIYNRALSAAEVTALYTATPTNTGGGATSTNPAPPGIPYQAEVRNESGEVLANANVNLRFTLHELTANGVVSYQETHAITTNELGLFAATIGAGTATQGTFAGINWSQTTKFLQVEVDAGNGYITMGNQQLMSVPYALYAANSQPGPQGAAGPQGPAGIDGEPGPQGPAGSGLTDGTNTGEMLYWDGESWTNIPPGSQAQTLTMCDGVPKWTSNGICPATITQLNCNSNTHIGNLIAGVAASSVTTTLTYNGGNGGGYNSQAISSTGVTGLTAHLAQGYLATGSGTITYTITGTPSSSGTASFQVNLDSKICTFTREVSDNVQEEINSHSCGALNVHNSALDYGSMTDQQGNVYKTIVIGNQEWMAENLNTSIYRNGELINNVLDNSQWAGQVTGAWCYYNNSPQFECPFGKLYNWYAATDPRNICPSGWHTPTISDWVVLTNTIGGEGAAGVKMKSSGSQFWLSPNLGATNESGFSGLPGGFRYRTPSAVDGSFNPYGRGALFWSSTQSQSIEYGEACYLDYFLSSIQSGPNQKGSGLSVRCIRD